MEFVQLDSSIHKPPYDEVTITYDAANSFNALLRDKETCFYEPGTTNRIDNPFTKEVEGEMQTMNDAALKAADEALNAAANAVDNAPDAVEDAPQPIRSEGAEKLANAVEANRPEALDACLEDASTAGQYEKCSTDYGAPR